ncbi:MAG: hypothetical protein GY832_07245 [Chloroflexi bacterium]|nr:hypothetical protein [Chloroflexota bacterium]
MNNNVHQIADEAAAAAVKRTFTALGIDIEDSDEIRHFQANRTWVRRFRRLSENVGTAVILTLVTLLTGGIAKLVWDSLKAKGGN